VSSRQARGHFPNDEAAIKLLFLMLHRAEKEWIMPPRERTMAKAQFANPLRRTLYQSPGLISEPAPYTENLTVPAPPPKLLPSDRSSYRGNARKRTPRSSTTALRLRLVRWWRRPRSVAADLPRACPPPFSWRAAAAHNGFLLCVRRPRFRPN